MDNSTMYHRTSKHAIDNGTLKSAFATLDQHLPVDEMRRNETLKLLYRETRVRENRHMPDRKLLLLGLIRYTDRNLPGIHLLVCIVMLLLLLIMNLRETNIEILLLLSMVLPGLLACLSAFELREICFVKMAELSETCFFHVRQLAALSMALSGTMNLIALSVGILFAGLQWKVKLLPLGLYVLVPFIFMQCICFGTMLTETGRKCIWLNAVLSIPLALLICGIASWQQDLYTESALIFWAIALFAGIAVLILETRILFDKLGKGDILCMNWN